MNITFKSVAQQERFQQRKTNFIIKDLMQNYGYDHKKNYDLWSFREALESTLFPYYTYKRMALRSCNAFVLYNENYALLISYKTPIALIDHKEKLYINFLEMVYCYTATSSQHARKFYEDYAKSYYVTYKYKQVNMLACDSEIIKKYHL